MSLPMEADCCSGSHALPASACLFRRFFHNFLTGVAGPSVLAHQAPQSPGRIDVHGTEKSSRPGRICLAKAALTVCTGSLTTWLSRRRSATLHRM